MYKIKAKNFTSIKKYVIMIVGDFMKVKFLANALIKLSVKNYKKYRDFVKGCCIELGRDPHTQSLVHASIQGIYKNGIVFHFYSFPTNIDIINIFDFFVIIEDNCEPIIIDGPDQKAFQEAKQGLRPRVATQGDNVISQAIMSLQISKFELLVTKYLHQLKNMDEDKKHVK